MCWDYPDKLYKSVENKKCVCDPHKKKIRDLIKHQAAANAINEVVKKKLLEIKQEIAKPSSSVCISKPTSTLSFADVLKSNNNGTVPKPRKDESNGVLVVPKTNQKSIEVEKAIRSNINLRDIKVGVTRVKHLRNRGVFLGTSSSANSHILEKEISKKLGEDYDVSQPKPALPKLVLSNIDRKYESEEMMEEIRSTNPGFDVNDGIKIIYSKNFCHEKDNQAKWLYILETKPQTFMILVNKYINFNEHFVKEKYDVTRCYNCQQYQHKGIKCSSQPVCARCAQNHKTSDCKRNLKNYSCINCVNSNKSGTNFNTNHTCGGKICEVHKKKIEIYQSRVSYMISPEW